MLFNTQSLFALSLAGLLSGPLVSAAPAHSVQRAANGVARRIPGGFYPKRSLASELTSFDPATSFASATTTTDLIAQAKKALDGYRAQFETALKGTSVPEDSQLALKANFDALYLWFMSWANDAPADVAAALSDIETQAAVFETWVKSWIAATPGIMAPTTTLPGSALPTGIFPTGTGIMPYPIGNSSNPTGGVHHQTGTAGPTSVTILTSAPVSTGTASAIITSAAAGPTGTSIPSKDGPGVAVWWGQSPKTVPMAQMCADESVDTIILSFLTTIKGPGGYPKIVVADMGPPTDAQKKAGATGLMDGSAMVADLTKCRKAGKKIMLSIGGEGGDATFPNDKAAIAFADQFWNLFLGGTDASLKPLRPFGDFVLDGVDIDNESKKPAGYVAFVTELRKKMNSSTAQDFKISAAPQCPREGQPKNQDASIPDDVLKLTDYVWVQYYNNGPCNHGAAGFLKSVAEWSKAVEPAQLWIGAPGSKEGAGSGYISPTAMTAEVKSVQDLNLKNFGGYALWDGSLAIGNDNYDAVIAKALAKK